MLVDMWMTPSPSTIAPTAPISKAAMMMVRQRIRRLIVIDEARTAPLVGIVSAGDVARAFPPELNPTSAGVTEDSVPGAVATIMTRDVQTVAAGTAIEAAARVMRDAKIGAVPVVRGAHVVGILTESDVFRAFVEMNDVGEGTVRVTFDLAEGEDVTATVGELCRAHAAAVTSILSFHHRDRHTGDRKRFGVVRIRGGEAALLDALWASQHRVLSVMHEAPSSEYC